MVKSNAYPLRWPAMWTQFRPPLRNQDQSSYQQAPDACAAEITESTSLDCVFARPAVRRHVSVISKLAFRVLAYSALIAVMFPSAGITDDHPPLTPAQQELIGQRDRHDRAAQELRDKGQLPEALGEILRMLAIEREVLGNENDDVVGSLKRLAEIHELRDDFTAACKARDEAFAIQMKRFTPNHWRVTDARLARADTERSSQLSADDRQKLREMEAGINAVLSLSKIGLHALATVPAQRNVDLLKTYTGEQHRYYPICVMMLAAVYVNRGDFARGEILYVQGVAATKRVYGDSHPVFADGLMGLGNLYFARMDYVRAEDLFTQALECRKRALGTGHRDYVTSLINLGNVYVIRGDLKRAEPILGEALAAGMRVLGIKDPEYARCLNSAGNLFEQMGDYLRAEPVLMEALAIRKKLVGENHRDYATSLNNLATLYCRMGDYVRAEPFFVQALAIHKRILGESDPAYATNLSNLAVLYSAKGDFGRAEPVYLQALAIRKKALGEAHPDYATSLNNVGMFYHEQMGDYARAESFAKQALAIYEKGLGEHHPNYAAGLSNLAELYHRMGDYARAETLHTQALAIKKNTLGESHLNYADSLSYLGGLYYSMGDYVRAESLYMQALAIDKKALGEMHPDYASGLNNLASLYHSMGDYVRAEPLFVGALAIYKKTLGELHPDYANGLGNLAQLYISMGDYARAETLLLQAQTSLKRTLAKTHPRYAASLNNLAFLYMTTGDYARAEPLYQQALEIQKDGLGGSHPEVAIVLSNLATLYSSKGDYVRAEPLYKQALEIQKNGLGETHPAYAMVLQSLAVLYTSMGEYERAESLLAQALAIDKTALGESHPTYAQILVNLAELYVRRGDYSRAKPLYTQAIAISLRCMELAAGQQSHRQQLAMTTSLRYQLDSYLSSACQSSNYAPSTFTHVLAWKGLVLSRQRATRALSDQPELQPLVVNLQSVTSRLATLAFSTPNPQQTEVWRRQIADLSAEKERLEAELAGKSATYRQSKRQVSLDDLQATITEEQALIDLLEYWHLAPPEVKGAKPQRQRRFAAFVVCPGVPVQLLDLGAAAPLEAAIDAWRSGFGRTRESAKAGQLLRERLWAPLEARLSAHHVSGKPRIKAVLISPDGALGKLPFAALPGKEPDSYLLEEWFIAVLPSSQVLVAWSEEKSRSRPTGNMLVLGGVDYDSHGGVAVAEPRPKKVFGGQRAPRDAAQDQLFGPLDATKGELATIERAYRATFDNDGITTLDGARASKAALVQEAPRHLYLHLATHGFFAPASFRSALGRGAQGLGADNPGTSSNQSLAGYHPGLLSGLALAGANKPTAEDDGILTAEEVSTLDLSRVELTVLSACETGLGQVAGGEGLLGLQRAFQAAGARTVIASLWSVDDVTTRDLMERFYDNLWNKDMGKLEALREAQLWMLRERGTRGLKHIEQENTTKRLSPYYWAAFVLSGDWR